MWWLTSDELSEIQAHLDANYEAELKRYNELVATNSPYLMFIAKPERINFWNEASRFGSKSGIRPHYGRRHIR